MDLNKKLALLKWLDALSVQSVGNFEDLRDVSVITDILCTCGDVLPDKDNLNSLETRLHSVRTYLEGFYHQSFEDGSLINFQLLGSNGRGDLYELEMGKLLLALLGCVIQDQARDKFIAPALEMDSQSQFELKEMIESVLFFSDTDTHLPPDFAEVLKRKTESSSHRDAALFFKLVADGRADPPQWTQGTPNSSICHNANDSMFAAMYSNSPQARNTSGFNIREISSPLRGMSISSPVTPLGALMYSPQLAQKAMLRKKMQEYRRLDIEHQNEKHLRQELEYDLEQCGQKIIERDNKIRELERQLGEVRRLRDNQDELEALRVERERLESHVKELQARLNEQQAVREQNQMLESEITSMLKEQKATRDELEMMNSVKKMSETYRVQSHKQQLTIKELEASLEHRNNEVEQLRQQLEEVDNMRQACVEKYNTAKREKEELEELYGSNQAGMSGGIPVYSGESMNVVTEKRLSELQVEYDQIRSTWIDPVTHHTVSEQLKQEEQAKLAFEEQYTRTKTRLMTCESDNEKLNSNVRQLENRVGTLENDLASSEDNCRGLGGQVCTLQSSEENLQAVVRDLRLELSKLQTELMLTQQEVDDQKKVSEDRRMTIAHLDEAKSHAINSEQQFKLTEQTLKSNIHELEISVEKLKGENKLMKDEVNVLKEKVTHMTEDNSELTIKLEQERSINANTVKKLNSDLSEEKMNNEQVHSNLKKLTTEYGDYRTKMNAKIEELTETVGEVSKEKTAVELEVRRLELELNSTKEKSQVKYERLDRELTERESQLNQIVEELERKNEDAERKLKNIVEELQASNSVIQEQKENIDKCNNTIEELKAKNTSLSEELEAANRKIVEFEYQIKSLREQLIDEQETAAQNMKALKIQYDNLQGQYTEEKACLNQQLEETKSQVLLLKDELDSNLKLYNEEKACLNQQMEESKSQIHLLKGDLDSNLQQHSEGKACLNQQLDETKSQILLLREELDSNLKLHSEEKSCLNQQLEETKSQILVLKDELDSNLKLHSEEKMCLQKQVEDVKSEHESRMCEVNSQHDNVVEELHSEINKLNNTIEDLKTLHSDKVSELMKLIEVKDSEKVELERLNNEKEARIDSMGTQLDYLKGVENSLKSALANLKTDYDKMKDMSKQREGMKLKLESVICDKDVEIDTLKNQISEFIEQQKVQLQDGESKMRLLDGEKNDLESKFSVYKAQSESEISELKDKLVEMESYWRSQCEQLEEEYAAGTQELREAHEKQVEELEKISEDKDLYMSSQKEVYQQKTQVLEKALQDRAVEIENLNSVMVTESDQRKTIQNEVNDLNEKLKTLHEEKEALIKEHENVLKEMHTFTEVKDTEIIKQKEEYEHKICELEKSVFEKLSEIESVNSNLLTERSEKERLQNEKEKVSEQLEQLKNEKKAEFEMLMEQQKDKLEDLRKKLNIEHTDIIGKTNSSYEKKLSELKSEMEEQRVNYQQMVCNMEEKLGGDVSMLKERLSQMKCQYEKLIESKEKDIKRSAEDWQSKIDAVTRENVMTEQQCSMEREQNNKFQSEIMVLSSKVTEYEKMLSESSSIQTDLKQKHEAGTENVKALETELASVKESLNAKEKELSGFRDSLGHEKGEKEELCRQLEYTQERNDTLTGELSSQQQQLAAVEEEKRQLEEQISQVVATQEAKLTQMRQQLETEKSMVELEKTELERQLQSSQKCYDAVQKSETELKHEAEKWRVDMDRLQEKNRELEQRLLGFLEEERKLKEENQLQRDRCTELNNNLQTQLRHGNMLQDTSTKMKQEYEQNIRALREQKTELEIEIASLSKVEETLKATEAERKKLEEHTELYKLHYNKKKEIIAQQAEQIEKHNQQLDYYKRSEEKFIKDYNPIKDKLNMEIMKNRTLNNQVRTLETQLDYANRKLKEYKQELEKATSVYLGDPSDFNKMIAARDCCEDASFMENHPSSVPLNTSVFEKENDHTLTPGTRNSRTRKRMSKSASSCTVSSADNADTISIGSATSLAYRLRSRESAVSLNRSITSFDSCKSNVPKGTGGIFHCEDEPMEFEWGRLGELSRRNTMCPSHLKTSYPVETQHYAPTRFQDDALRQSTIGNDTVISIKSQQTMSGRKRKQDWDSTDSGSDSADSKTSKQAKTGCVYHKPGPPTPANSRRSSKGSRSPNTRRNSGKGSSSRSPRTPLSLRGRRTPKRTPKTNTPKRSTAVESRSNNGSGKKSTKRESVAFNVGFSPLSLGRSNRLTRQQAFIQKQPPSTTQTQPQVRKPLGTRNFLQTGL